MTSGLTPVTLRSWEPYKTSKQQSFVSKTRISTNIRKFDFQTVWNIPEKSHAAPILGVIGTKIVEIGPKLCSWEQVGKFERQLPAVVIICAAEIPKLILHVNG